MNGPAILSTMSFMIEQETILFMIDLESDLRLAQALAEIADELSLASFRRGVTWRTKADGSPVSVADYAVEKAIAEEISVARPDDVMLGEETSTGATDPSGAVRRWIVDPIDQTRHYVRGNPEYATLIALSVNDEIVVGVVSAPALGHRWWATRAGGAWKDGEQITTSQVATIDNAYLAIAGHYEWHEQWSWPRVRRLLARCSYAAGCPGGFLQQMLVAEGRIDVFAEPWGDTWDHDAPSLIVEEAGGRVSRLDGSQRFGESLLATNGPLHDIALPFFVATSMT